MNRISLLWGVVAGLSTCVLWVLSIPPFDFAEAVYVAFVPVTFWLYTQPRIRHVLLIGFFSGWLAWFSILIWLRHVTLIGTILLSGLMAGFFLIWLVFAAKLLPSLFKRVFIIRILGILGIAGLWIVLEWSRTWIFWGFPWAPISLSQWERPVVLQMSAWTGAYGVSFLLIFFNCCVAQTLRQRLVLRERKMWSGWFSPELYLALGGLGLTIVLFFRTLPFADTSEELFKAGVVQPYIPPELKWDAERELVNLEILERQTQFVASLENDLILWPEAATPWPIVGFDEMRTRVERLVNVIGKPILMGSLAMERDAEGEIWSNGAFYVEPGSGLEDTFYVKRELVPFGEYVPKPFGFIEKVVPIGGSFQVGKEPGLIPIRLNEREIKVGPLVCYEDVFPQLARVSAAAGAQIFFVTTNNAWYGEEGGAEQHAAHSVLRAVENRRPVMRCGNGGWSGWIDSYGNVRDVLLDESGSIYFRGGGSY
ncbi:MAG: apolipoprotein N-acyltransferase, partial [Verrucomicrobiota bacterium]